jgi:hypothetical protein
MGNINRMTALRSSPGVERVIGGAGSLPACAATLL